MSGFVKKAKKKAGLFVDKLRPGSRQPSPTPPDPISNPPAPSTDRHSYADPQPPQSAGATAGSVIHELLAAARDGSDLCLPLKAALTGVVKIWDVCERTTQMKDEYQKLESRLAHFTAVTRAYGDRNLLDPNLKLRLDHIVTTFAQLASSVEAKLERGTTRRVLESNADVAEVKDLLVKLSARIEAFIYESVIRVEIAVNAILARLPTPDEQELEKELTRWTTTTQAIKSAFSGRRVHEAAHTVQPKSAGCMPGTRVGLLCKLITWIKTDARKIFWLAGMAGTGKTSVALTLCQMLDSDADVLLGGSFFCSRTANVEARTDVRRVIPTLAALLARQSPKFAVELAAELRPNSGVAGHQPVGEQIGPLLQRPLTALASEARPIVFVIDALDECSNERELAELLTAISTFTCDANVKFILTSRPETHILGSPISDRDQNEILQLHTIETAEVTEDIRLYLDDAFSKKPLAKPWYTSADVARLAKLADGLFIFASTMISYVLDSESITGRTTRLQTALAAVTGSAVAMGPLDAMYELVITRASNAAKVEPTELEMTRRTLACILVVRSPPSVAALADLLDLETDDLRESLRRLQATVHVPIEDDEPGLRMLHASFGDYLIDRAAISIRLTKSVGDDLLARGCLRVMRKRLHFNISQSRSSYEQNSGTKPDSIVLSLEYASLRWVDHITGLPDPLVLVPDVSSTFRPRFMFWLEVMSILGQMRRAAAILIIATDIFRSSSLSTFVHDASLFVASSREAIERSAPHIYLSALPFAAKDSPIYQTFSPLCKGLVSVETVGLDRHGGRIVMTLIGHAGWVNSVSYSADGRRLASGSSDGTVRVWDMWTGEESISPLRSDNGAVYSVAFAPSGNRISSGTDAGAVCIWNIQDIPATEKRLNGHTSTVWSVAFSPDGTILASASKDQTACLWSTTTGQQIAALRGHTDGVNAVAFSADGGLLASGSGDKTIRLWDTNTNELVREPLQGHSSAVSSLAFSPDGRTLASGSTDKTIMLWDYIVGSDRAALGGHSSAIRAVKFSLDGRLLVSAGDDNHVRLRSLTPNTDEESIVLGHHSGYIQSVTFSPDSLWVASASADNSIRIWDASIDRAAVQLPSNAEALHSLAMSPNGTAIASGSYDGSIGIWDACSGEQMLPRLLGHTNTVNSVAVSADGQRIASASDDGTVRMWDLSTGDSIGEPLLVPGSRVAAVAFSPDSLWLASGSADKVVRLWDAQTGESSQIEPLVCANSVCTVLFSSDGQLLAASDYHGLIHLWHTSTGQPAREPLQTNNASALFIDFSPTGVHIVSGGIDKAAYVWDIGTGHQLFALEGHTAAVQSVVYSRDGRFIGTGSWDGTVRLWDAMNGTSISTLYGHGEWIGSVVFTPDAQSVASCSGDSTIRIWDVETSRQMFSDNQSPANRVLASTKLDRGWRVGPSDELLLWVPPDYRDWLHSPPCKIYISDRRVVVTENQGGLYAGEDWTACWRKGASL